MCTNRRTPYFCYIIIAVDVRMYSILWWWLYVSYRLTMCHSTNSSSHQTRHSQGKWKLNCSNPSTSLLRWNSAESPYRCESSQEAKCAAVLAAKEVAKQTCDGYCVHLHSRAHHKKDVVKVMPCIAHSFHDSTSPSSKLVPPVNKWMGWCSSAHNHLDCRDNGVSKRSAYGGAFTVVSIILVIMMCD